MYWIGVFAISQRNIGAALSTKARIFSSGTLSADSART